MIRLRRLVLVLVFSLFGVVLWQIRLYVSPVPYPPLAPAATASLAGPVWPIPADLGNAPQPVRVELGPFSAAGFPERATVFDGSCPTEVHYTGKILRKRAVLLVPVNIYEIAAYVEEPAEADQETLLDEMLVDGPVKLFVLRFLLPLPGRAILADIRQAIVDSFGDVDMGQLQCEIDRFCGQFGRGASRGEMVYIVWLPGGRIYSGFHTADPLSFIAADEPMARAIWRVWAGPDSENRVDLVERFTAKPR